MLLGFILFLNCENESRKKEAITSVKTELISVEIQKSELVKKPNIGLVYYQDKPFTGTSLLNYTNGNKAETIQYLNGKKEGALKKWFEDGMLSFESFYQNGKLEKTSKSWWKNGKLRSESNYTNGVANGIQTQWYKTGQKFKQMTIVNGKEEGMQKAWRLNGKIYNNYEAKNGRIFGLKRAGLCFELEDEIVQTK